MSRIKNNIINAKINFVLFFFGMLLTLVSRSYFLQKLGDEFNGVLATIGSVIGILTLLEMGLSSSVSYKLYEPIFNKDKEKIAEIISILRKLYRLVGFTMLIMGVLISFLIPFYFTTTKIPLQHIFIFYFCYLFISLFFYFFNYSKILLVADQKNHKVNTLVQLINYLKIISQLILLYYTNNYFLWILIEIVCVVFQSILLHLLVKKEYPWLKIYTIDLKTSSIYYEIKIKVKQIIVHNLSRIMLHSTDSIFIGLYVGINTITYYNNYYLIFNNLNILFGNIFANITPSIGNLLIEKDEKKKESVFYELMILRFIIAITFFIALYFSLEYFIVLWLKKEYYILSDTTLILMLCVFFILQIRSPVDSFIQGFGLYHDTWAPMAEFLINFVLTLILGYYFGINGILLGTVISMMLIVVLWKPYLLFKSGFRSNVSKYWYFMFKISIPVPFVFFIISFLKNSFNFQIDTFFSFFVYGFLIFILTLFLLTISYLKNQYFRNLLLRFKIPF